MTKKEQKRLEDNAYGRAYYEMNREEVKRKNKAAYWAKLARKKKGLPK
jgi:hypothetical protein